MASSAEIWRRRVERALGAVPSTADPKLALLASVVGQPSAELDILLAADSVPAAVLVALIDRPDGVQLLFTERAAHLAHHAGQISFPGGRLAGTDETPVAAALREAAEEVGLASDRVEVLGALRPRLTGTGFSVTPIVGWLGAAFTARPDPAEVASVFEVPLEHLLATGTANPLIRERFGTRFKSYEFHFGAHRIWGATAAIIADLIELIDGKT